MPLFVVAYPQFCADDHAWIERVRAEHDAASQRLVGPHVTLVFRCAGFELGELVAHASAAAGGVAPFECTFRQARAVQDVLSTDSHVFLIPGAGHDVLVDLHERLYGGPLAAQRRVDLPFVPHLTVARKASFEAAENLAGLLEATRFDLYAQVAALAVLSLRDGALAASQVIQLRSP